LKNVNMCVAKEVMNELNVSLWVSGIFFGLAPLLKWICVYVHVCSCLGASAEGLFRYIANLHLLSFVHQIIVLLNPLQCL
jgi:hypothetical protein